MQTTGAVWIEHAAGLGSDAMACSSAEWDTFRNFHGLKSCFFTSVSRTPLSLFGLLSPPPPPPPPLLRLPPIGFTMARVTTVMTTLATAHVPNAAIEKLYAGAGASGGPPPAAAAAAAPEFSLSFERS